MQNYFSSLKYPCKGTALVPIILGVICLFVALSIICFLLSNKTGLWYTQKTTYFGLFFLFFLLAYLSRMILDSALGDDTICDSPQFLDRFEDVVWEPGCRSLTVILTYALPALVALCFGANILSGLLMIAGCLFLPMAFMRTSVLESLEGINPGTCLDFLSREPAAYLKLLFFSLIWFSLLIIPIAALLILDLSLILFIFIYSVYAFYLLSVYMNILGRFYRKYATIIEGE